jgi:hypothetical protein
MILLLVGLFIGGTVGILIGGLAAIAKVTDLEDELLRLRLLLAQPELDDSFYQVRVAKEKAEAIRRGLE